MEVRGDGARGLLYKIVNGKKARFWRDPWLGECPLNLICTGLFEICNQRVWTS
jgi:hypothetical protein